MKTTTDAKGQVWNKESIQQLLATNDKAVGKALLVLLANQTADERATGQTKEHNGRGFTGCDAEILTSFAQQFQLRGWLSPKQIIIARRKLNKYWQQLLKAIAQKNQCAA
jgi:hypothetical protein